MATPPFSLNITIPGDTDVVSQFPGVDRTHLGIINSWINTEHNLNGTHSLVTLLQVGQPDSGGVTVVTPTPAANNTSLFRDTDGAIKAIRGDDSTVEFMGGVPPGAVVHYAGATLPVGWLWADGTNVSRTTYARLFTALGTTYGVGDGSTTFGLPDLNGRGITGRDRTGTNRVTTAGSGVDGTTLAASGGNQNKVLIQANLPNISNMVTSIAAGQGSHTHLTSITSSAQAGTGSVGSNQLALVTGVGGGYATSAGTLPAMTGTTATGGTDTPVQIMNPTIVLNAIIRT